MTLAGRVANICEPPAAAEGCYGLRPQDLHSAYGLPTTASSEQIVAVVDAYDDPRAEEDLNVYAKEFGLPACTAGNSCFTKVNEKGKAAPLPESEGGWAEEISLDIEIVHATCESCKVLLVEADNESYDSLEAAEETAANMGASEISDSWGGGEPTADSMVFNHPGIVIAAAAGDDGYAKEYNPFTHEHVNYPASSPHVVGVGGTRLSITTEGAWAGETVWNGDGAGGGGCSERFEASPWQQQLANWTSVGCGSMRAVADVSADADPYTGVAFYDSATIVERKSGVREPIGWGTVGGTSLATPLIASTFALAGGAGGVAYPAKTLYEHEAGSPASLHDVETGSNGACAKAYNRETGLSGCTALEEGESCFEEAVCLAGLGYDGPTGVGTPNEIGAFQAPSEPAKTAQTSEFTSNAPTAATVGGTTYTVTATASSGLPVALTSGTPWVCSMTGATVSFGGAGTCTIDANQAGNATYEAAPEAQQSFTVSKGPQTIDVTSSAPTASTVGGPTYTVTATASSGLPVAFTSGAPSVCTVEGATVSFVGSGACTIDASQSGNSNYEAAPQVQQSFAVGKGSQRISFTSTPPSSETVGGPTYTVTATASSGLPVAFTSGAPSVCTVEGATVSFVGSGACTIDAGQSGNSNYEAAPRAQQSVAVSKLSQTIEITSSPPASAAVGGSTYTLTASASSGLAVSFASDTSTICSLKGATVSFVGAGTCTIDAGQAGNAEYEAAPALQQSFVVAKRAQRLEFVSTAPALAIVGGLSYTVSAVASSGLPVLLSSATTSVCTLTGVAVSFVGVGTCTIEADQAGDGEYAPALRVQESFTVGKGHQAIMFISSPPSGETVGGSTYTVSASASSGLPVSFSSETPSVCALERSTVSFVGAGTCTIDAGQAGSAGYEAAVQAQQSFTVGVLSALSPTSTLTSPFPMLPDSSFSLHESPAVNAVSGAVTFVVSVADPGTFSWLLTFPDGRFGAVSARRRQCGAHRARRKRRCRSARAVFGKGALKVSAAGATSVMVTFTVSPSAAAKRALHSARRNRGHLIVSALLRFHSSLGGSPTSHTYSIKAILGKAGASRRKHTDGKRGKASSR